jgi:hypothetical protein
LPEAELTALRAAPDLGDRPLASNGEGPARLDPCPWAEDESCDEFFEVCAAGTDPRLKRS